MDIVFPAAFEQLGSDPYDLASTWCTHFSITLRRRNTRYENPQLVAQHCFDASLVDVSRLFFTVRNQLVAQQNICCGLKKVVAKSRARVYFVQQILGLLLVFHQTHNLARNKFAEIKE